MSKLGAIKYKKTVHKKMMGRGGYLKEQKLPNKIKRKCILYYLYKIVETT